MNDKDLESYLDANFTAIRAETKAVSDVIAVELKKSRELNEEQHKNILDKMQTLTSRITNCEAGQTDTHKRVVDLEKNRATLKGAWLLLIAMASLLGPIVTLIIEHSLFTK